MKPLAGLRVIDLADEKGELCGRILTDLGAEVYALDVQDIKATVHRAIKVDLTSEASIDAALAEIEGEIDCLFNCAGLPGAPHQGSDGQGRARSGICSPPR